jgi:endonuclease-3 related protein
VRDPQTESPDPRLLAIYERLRAQYGHRNWWPGESPLEVIVGAILTQNTAWRNVVRAIANLRAARILSVSGLRRVPTARLAALVRPSGYFRQKARKLKAFVGFLDREHAGRVAPMRRADPSLRDALLSVHGVGPETADSILLYALEKPFFVVDAYTRRVLERHRIVPPGLGYEEIRAFLEARVPRDVPLWNDFHAQFVAVGHHHCGPTPRCAGCPLEAMIPPGGIRLEARRAPRARRVGGGARGAGRRARNAC